MNAQPKPVVLMISLGAILVASFLMLRNFHSQPKPGRRQDRLHEMIGETAATEITKLVGGRGQIGVVCMDTSQSQIRPLEQELTSFQIELARRGQVKIVVTKKVPENTNVFARKSFAVPADIYLGLLKDHPELDGIVSFVGAPMLTEEQVLQLPSKRPRFVAVFGVSYTGPALKMLLEKEVVQTLILENPTPLPITDGRLPSPEEIYKLTYLVVGPSTANLLPEE